MQKWPILTWSSGIVQTHMIGNFLDYFLTFLLRSPFRLSNIGWFLGSKLRRFLASNSGDFLGPNLNDFLRQIRPYSHNNWGKFGKTWILKQSLVFSYFVWNVLELISSRHFRSNNLKIMARFSYYVNAIGLKKIKWHKYMN